MAYTFHELKEKTVAELREIAAGVQHEAVQGYTQLNKEHLLQALCKALGIDTHEHCQVEGIDKTTIKTRIRGFKKKRDEALAARDYATLKPILRQIHHLKRKIKKVAV